MRAAVRAVAVLWWVVGCTPVSIHPTYQENQLISVPGLEGLWRDSVEGAIIAVTAVDSLSYLATIADGTLSNNVTASSSFTLNLARVGRDTFIDFRPRVPDETGRDFLNWYRVPLHAFSLVELGRDRILLKTIHGDSLSAMIARSPRQIGHVISDRRFVLTAATSEVQAFLINASGMSGATDPMVWRRLGTGATCDAEPADTVEVESEPTTGARFYDSGVRMRRLGDSTALVTFTAPSPASVLAPGFLAANDTITTDATDQRFTLSRTNPLIAVTYADMESRMELRWIGVDTTGQIIVHAVGCHDLLPSSRTALEMLSAPETMVSEEGQRNNERFRYSWTRVRGATSYELRRWGDQNWQTLSRYHSTFTVYDSSTTPPRRVEVPTWGISEGGYRKANDRFVVQDTSIVPATTTYSFHRWKVRAYAAGVGFGPWSEVKVENRQGR